MDIALIIALAVGAAVLPPPLSLVCIVVLTAWHVIDRWTRRNALKRVAQGVADKLDKELTEVIASAVSRRQAQEEQSVTVAR